MNFQTTTSTFLNSLGDVSTTIGTGNVVADIVLVLLVLSLMALFLGIVSLYRGPRQQEGGLRGDNLEGRLEKLEMNVGEYKADVARGMESFKGEVGYLKQELQEVKQLLRSGTPRSGDDFYDAADQKRQNAFDAAPETLDSYAARGARESISEAAIIESALPETAPESLSRRLTKSRRGLFDRLKGFFSGKAKIEEASFAELEEILVGADFGVKTTQALLTELRSDIKSGADVDEARLLAHLKQKVLNIFEQGAKGDQGIQPRQRDGMPMVVLMVGVNGVGKTTTTAKLARMWKDKGAKVMMVAADTFRAAAVEQIREWGKRLDVPVIYGAPEAKPQTVVFDAMMQAKEQQIDIVIIDTAGRLHTKSNLMQELEGVRGAIGKHIPGAPHETILVLDGATGQNALNQAREFNGVAKLSGLIITKLDGTPKGGIVVAIKDELGVPVRYIGVGEGPLDLRTFVAREYVEALFDSSELGEHEGQNGYSVDNSTGEHAQARRRKRRDTQSYI